MYQVGWSIYVIYLHVALVLYTYDSTKLPLVLYISRGTGTVVQERYEEQQERQLQQNFNKKDNDGKNTLLNIWWSFLPCGTKEAIDPKGIPQVTTAGDAPGTRSGAGIL